MKTYIVETESGFIREELIHLQDAIEVGENMATSFETRVIVRDYLGDVVKVIPYKKS